MPIKLQDRSFVATDLLCHINIQPAASVSKSTLMIMRSAIYRSKFNVDLWKSGVT